jgi:hypothetical protein
MGGGDMRTKGRRAAIRACLLCSALIVTALGAQLAFAAVANDVPGTKMTSPFVTSGTVDAAGDSRDVYAIDMRSSNTMEATLTGEPGTDFDLWLYPPGTKSVVSNGKYIASSSRTATSTEDFTFMAWDKGTYYLEVHAYSGSGQYELNVHPIAPLKFTLGAIGAKKSAKKGKYVKVSTSLTPAYNNRYYTPIRFYFYRYEKRHWKLKATKWGFGWQDVGRAKSLVWANYKFPKKGSWRMRARFWDPAHYVARYTAYKKITIK